MLKNPYDLDYDDESGEIYYVTLPVKGRIVATVFSSDAKIYRYPAQPIVW